jgi:hypothetical protein
MKLYIFLNNNKNNKNNLLIKLINNYKNYNIISFLFNIEIF